MKPMFLAWGYGKNNNSPHIKVKIIGYIGYIGYNTTCGASNSHHDARKFCYSYCNFRYDARTEISDARSAQKFYGKKFGSKRNNCYLCQQKSF